MVLLPGAAQTSQSRFLPSKGARLTTSCDAQVLNHELSFFENSDSTSISGSLRALLSTQAYRLELEPEALGYCIELDVSKSDEGVGNLDYLR